MKTPSRTAPANKGSASGKKEVARRCPQPPGPAACRPPQPEPSAHSPQRGGGPLGPHPRASARPLSAPGCAAASPGDGQCGRRGRPCGSRRPCGAAQGSPRPGAAARRDAARRRAGRRAPCRGKAAAGGRGRPEARRRGAAGPGSRSGVQGKAVVGHRGGAESLGSAPRSAAASSDPPARHC